MAVAAKSRLHRAACIFLLPLTLALACSAQDLPDDPVVARSDTATLRASDVRKLLAGLDVNTQQLAGRDPQLMLRLLKQELGRRALEQQAQAQKWEQRPEVIAEIERSRREVVASSYLQSVSAPPAGFPSDAELQEAYKLNQQLYLAPRSYHLEQIFVAIPADAAGRTAAEAKIRQLAREVRNSPERFADLARSESDAKAGGDLGWVAESQVVPEIRNAVQGLARDQISDPISAAGGWHLLKLIDTRPAQVAPFDQVKNDLAARLRQQRTQQNAAGYVSQLLDQQHAAVDEISLQKVLQPAKTSGAPVASK